MKGYVVVFRCEIRFLNRIIDSVVNVKSRYIIIADTASANIRFICKDQSCCNSIHRNTGSFVMVADGSNDRCDFSRFTTHIV